MENPNYYAILTAEVRYDNRLTPNEKLLFAEITALSNKNGYCNASNGYFAELYKVNKTTVSRWISHLKQNGYINVVVERDKNKQIIDRKLYIIECKKPPIVEKHNTPPISKNVNTLLAKMSIPISKNAKGNNTSINITRIDITNLKQEVEKLYLNFYPRHVGKVKGINKAVNEIKNGKITLTDLETCIKNYANEVKDRDPKYIKHFSTFMNGDYIDYLQPINSNPPKQTSHIELLDYQKYKNKEKTT